MKKLLITLFATALLGSAVAAGSASAAQTGPDTQVHALGLPPQQLVGRRNTQELPGRAVGGGRPAASPLLVEVLPLLPVATDRNRPLLAIDLGYRDRLDSLDLLHLGWTVLAVTETARAKKQLLAGIPNKHFARLTIQVGEFRALALPSADLISAGTDPAAPATGSFRARVEQDRAGDPARRAGSSGSSSATRTAEPAIPA